MAFSDIVREILNSVSQPMTPQGILKKAIEAIRQEKAAASSQAVTKAEAGAASKPKLTRIRKKKTAV